MTYSSRTGVFAGILGLDLPNGLQLDAVYGEPTTPAEVASARGPALC